MRLSVCLDPGRRWNEVRALAEHTEAVGLAWVWVCDHFMPHDPSGEPADGPVLEGWTTLAALATRTTALRLGTLVLGASYRTRPWSRRWPPRWTTSATGGFILGLGAGWQQNEHLAYGIELQPPG